MLSKSQRATTTCLKEAIKKRKTYTSLHFSAHTSPISSPTTTMVVISKKVVPTAARRNRLKRRVRETLNQITLPTNKMVVIYAKKGASALTFKDIKKELVTLLQ